MRTPLFVAFAALGLLSCTKNQGDPPAGSALPNASPPQPSAVASTAPPPAASAGPTRPSDILSTPECALRITPLHHATFLLQCGDLAIYFDPVHDVDYTGLPKASMVFITDIHGDHLDLPALESVRQEATSIIAPPAVAAKLPAAVKNVTALKNGATETVRGVQIEAIPMYNLVRGPKPGALFHDKGRGDGYVLTLHGKRIYVSGDTECTPEMKALQNIDVAFVCMNLPYTMPPSEAAACVNAFRPKIVYPYHYRDSDPRELEKAVTGSGTEVRLRDWYAK